MLICSGCIPVSEIRKDAVISIAALIPKRKLIKYGMIFIPLGIIANLIFSLFKTNHIILKSMSSFSFTYLLLAVGLTLVPWITNSMRNWIWLRFLKADFSFRDTFKIIVAMDLGAAVSPTAVGGGYVKMAMFMQKGLSSGTAASLMTLGSVEDFTFFLLAVPFSLIWTSASEMSVMQSITHHVMQVGLILGKTAVLFLALLLLFWILKKTGFKKKLGLQPLVEKSARHIKKFRNDFFWVYSRIIKQGKYRFLCTVFLTAIQWTCRFSVITALLACMHIPVNPVKFFLFQWIVFTIMTVTPTPGAALGAEAGFLLVYSQSIPAEVIGLALGSWRFLTYYFLLLLAALVFLGLHLQKEKSILLPAKKKKYSLA